MHWNNKDYIRLRDLPVGENFFVHLAGNTNQAHRDWVSKFVQAGHREVQTYETCDYCLVFCPVTSRVGTDVEEALSNAPANKPVILVVMHHTFDQNYTVAESRRLVSDTNVHLTVDCLFYENRFLQCNTNDIAWHEIQKLCQFSQKSNTSIQSFLKKHAKAIIGGGAVLVMSAIITVIFKLTGKRWLLLSWMEEKICAINRSIMKADVNVYEFRIRGK
ncbi:uncharacterized protein LOC115037753 isoform X4 [Echeneis naucrates]|uniref:uncharacterized protein LOC115037753 isoform X3 n=1 Tax=Echeneis naucrates TaxID=173247 RepID=UPI00111465AA|nr:uncharacterized protein LOC115037753 isoform X3 [Echeneis naucrates]XP_029352334.1 uncharacterized protein LOC115037753 isoform X4 [Echeneis naucrates]